MKKRSKTFKFIAAFLSILLISLIFLLASCNNKIDNSKTTIGVMTQEYNGKNIAEILMLNYDGEQPALKETGGKNPEIDSFNNSIKFGVQQIYNDFTAKNTSGEDWIEIKSYPFTSDKYLQIVTTYIEYPIYGTDGNITSYNFDKKANKFMALSDVMDGLGLTNDSIAQKVKELYVPASPTMSVKEVNPTGFLMRQGTLGLYTEFLLEVTIDDSESGPWIYFYGYSPELNKLEQLNPNCLFDPSDMDQMDPPLSYQNLGNVPSAGMDENTAMGILNDMFKIRMNDEGLALVASGEDSIDGQHCWLFDLGKNAADKFTAEEHYAVRADGNVFVLNILTGKYETFVGG